MKYTEGGWMIQDFGDETIEIYVPKVGMVAKCNRRVNEQAKANAQLIAAAPAMYATLETILGNLDDGFANKNLGTKTMIKQVLAEAEGK